MTDERRLSLAQKRAINRRVFGDVGETLGPRPTVARALDLLGRAGLSEAEARAFLEAHR